jgi:hypothetical protein
MQFIKATNPPTKDVLVSILGKALGGYRPARQFTTIHASMLTETPEFCPREVVLLLKTKKKRKEQYVDAAMQVAFDNGQALHELFRNKWLRDIAVGTWKCKVCKAERPFSKYPKDNCNTCGCKLWDYEEELWTSQTHGFQGSTDTLLDLDFGKHTIVELKSMDKDMFNSLKAPMGEHRVRTILYMYLVKDSGRPERERVHTDSAKILYISKAFGQKSSTGAVLPFKEFDVEYNESTIAPYLEKAAKVKKFKDAGVVPAGVCPTSFVNRVKSCSCPHECWSNKYPPTV